MDKRGLRAVAVIAVAMLASASGAFGEATVSLTGRVSPQIALTTYPSDSAFREVFGSGSVDSALDARFVFRAASEHWRLDVDYQLVGVYGDRLEFSRLLAPELQGLYPHLPSDRTRLFDFTYVFTDTGKSAALQRLDRAAVGYASDNAVLKFGRQAITWGNGLVFNVMDIFNPFDPAAVDKEYKTGDDMLYGQYLLSGGDDVQGVMVFRRDPVTEELEADQSSLALKYHHMSSASEVDALVAQHYGDPLLGAGMNYNVGGAVWRGDSTVSFGEDETVASFVTSLSYSWIWGGKNVSGVAEYFYNGFGQSDGCYSPECLVENPELLKRVARGELFNLGQHYLALSAMIEIDPLFLLTPNAFVNVADPSALVQLVFQNDLRENLLLWSAINLPIGANGTEFGGAATRVSELFLSAGPSASLQLVWYW